MVDRTGADRIRRMAGVTDSGTVRELKINNDGEITARSVPFNPIETVTLNTTSTSGRVQLPINGGTMIVRNYGPNRAFIRRGINDVVAGITDYPIEAYTVDVLSRDTSANTHLAAICANSGETASLSISCGEGGA